MKTLMRIFDRLRGVLPAPEPRCIVNNWGYRCGKPWRIVL